MRVETSSALCERRCETRGYSFEWPATKKAALAWAGVDTAGFLLQAQLTIAREISRLKQADADDNDDAVDQLETAYKEVQRVRATYVESWNGMTEAGREAAEAATT